MHVGVALDPKLDVVAAAMVEQAARFVVVGGFAVIANRFVRATEDVDLLIPDQSDNDSRILKALAELNAVRYADEAPVRPEHLREKAYLRVRTDAGIVDLMRGGLPPLDFDTVAREAMQADYGGVEFLVAGLRSIVAFKRLSDRPRDRNDLIALAEIHGDLPVDPIPGLDE